jgi:hypothetical protein
VTQRSIKKGASPGKALQQPLSGEELMIVPLVTDVGADVEPAAELAPVGPFLQSKAHKLMTLIHY